MTQGTPEGGQGQTGNQGQGAGGDAGTGQQQGAGAPGDQGQQQAGQQGNAAGQGANQTGQQTGQAQGQQQGQGAPDDGLTEEERNALTDPGKRALERVRTERETARAEVETLRGQLTEALAQANKGTDAAVQQQITEATTAREAAERSTMALQSVMRAGLAKPREGETGEQFATRVSQLAGLLQGNDQAALDNAAAVLASTFSGQQQTGQQQVARNADQQAGGQNQNQAGELSMDDRIRAAAGRQVTR